MKRNTLFALGLLSIAALVPVAASGCSDTEATADASTPTADAVATTEPEAAATTEPDATVVDSAKETSVQGCTAALETLLKPIDKVSTGEVTILADGGGERLLFVDATAGGAAGASQNPRTYVSLATGKRVDVTDKSAATSTDWDLALERAVLFTNSGHGGPGSGSAVYVAKPFADVTAADAAGKTFPAEAFVDGSCNPIVDQTGAIKSTFDGWYDYDGATNKVTPKTGTYVVKGGKGALYKVAITQYYATADGGGPGLAGANYTIRVGAL